MKVVVRGYKNDGFGAGFIKWFTLSCYSHVSFVFNLDGKPVEIEAMQGKGVHKMHPREHSTFDEFVVPLTVDQQRALWDLCEAKVGADYDWLGCWSFVRRKNRNNPNKMFCSELIADGLRAVGYPLSRREPWRESPSTICESLRLLAYAKEEGGA